MSDLIGQTIGNYRVESLLGKGGMSQVFAGVHLHLNRRVAIKVMYPHIAADASFQQRFLQEAQAIAALAHPNIIEVYDFGEQAGQFYLVLELIISGSLRDLLQQARSTAAVPLDLALDLARQAADALAYAHQQGMVHRDVKPDNMMLKQASGAAQAARPTLKLTDFGLARLREGTTITATGMTMGTPAYMAPEQCQGGDLDGRCDIYALGVVLYELVTGTRPFPAKTISEAVHQHINLAPPPLRQVRADLQLPEDIEPIILRCLAKRPDERYATAAELSSDLSAALQQLASGPAVSLNGPTVLAPAPAAPAPVTPSAPSAPAAPAPGMQSVAATAIQPTTAGSPPLPQIPALGGTSKLPRVQVVDAQGRVQVVELNGDGLTIGRRSGNSVVLQTDKISRHHVRIDWDGARVTLTDLGSSNGTFLGGARLEPQEARHWPWGEQVRIGDYRLRLEPPTPDTSTPSAPPIVAPPAPPAQASPIPAPLSGAQVPSAAPTGMAPQLSAAPTRLGSQPPKAASSSGRIFVTLEQPAVALTPGQSTTVSGTVANHGATIDHFTITVEGVPADWVVRLPPGVQLFPGQQTQFAIELRPPRSPQSRAGEYRLTVRAHSREQAGVSGAAMLTYTVQRFYGTELDLMPKKVGGRTQASYTIALRNVGNGPEHYQLSATDDEMAQAYHFDPERVRLNEGDNCTVKLAVGAPRRLIGSAQPHDFKVQAEAAESGAAQTTSAQFVHRALVPVWLPPAAIAVLLAVAFGLYNLLVRPPVFVGSGNFAPANPLPGQAVTVLWRVNNAQSITLQPQGLPEVSGLDPGAGAYTFADGFASPTRMTIVATNRFGLQEKAEVTIAVAQPELGQPQLELFEVTPQRVTQGQPVTITWRVRDADSVELQPFGTMAISGTKQATPDQTITYTLIAANKGRSANWSAQVVVDPPPPNAPQVTAFTADPASLVMVEGEQPVIQLKWTTTNATVVSIEGIGIVEPEGSREIPAPKTTMTYTLVAKNAAGQKSEGKVDVRIEPARCSAQQNLDLRSGPGTAYQLLSTLSAGTNATPRGLSPDGQWIQVRAEPGGALGWVSANTQSVSCNVELTRVRSVPPNELPATPVPPTATPVPPTPTPIPPTFTPIPPTNTPVPPAPTVKIPISILPLVKSFAGTWYHNVGTMELKQQGNHVFGTFHEDIAGVKWAIEGTVSDGIFIGALSFKPNAPKAPISWSMSKDGKTLDGKLGISSWKFCGARPGAPFPDGCTFAGTWTSSVAGDSNCIMNLQRVDMTVHGTYCHGTMSGTIEYYTATRTTLLRGTWVDGNKNIGSFTLYLYGDGLQFQGNWGKKGLAWCGKRSGVEFPSPCER